MKRNLLLLFLAIIYCNVINAQEDMTIGITAPPEPENPFFRVWKTPFEVPPFDQIKNRHYIEAFTAGIEKHQKEIDAIVGNQSPPTFENTLEILDNSGELLDKVSSVFYGLNSANTNQEMQGIARKISPMLTKHGDDISLNEKLFGKIKKIYDAREKVKYNADQKRLIEETYKRFVRNGARLNPEDKKKLRELNTEINLLQLEFQQNLLAENNGYRLVIDNPEDLKGLPANIEATAREAGEKDTIAKGNWMFTLQNPSVIPFLQFDENRTLREKIQKAYISRGNNNNKYDNKTIIAKLVVLRQKKARLLGYNSYADYVLDDRMAKKPENVYKLLNEIWVPALAMAKKERDSMQKYIRRTGENFELEAWDWRFYTEKVRRKLFSFDEESVKPYFRLENVRDGIFYVSNKLYGITFKQVNNVPVYDPDVTLWECKDRNGSLLGVFYLDMYPREGKRGGAWTGSYRSQKYRYGRRVAPVMTIVCNFTPPSSGIPSLLTADETETFFHEFGHNLAGLLRDVKYDGIAGVPRDFVELPSQIMEHWAFEPEVLNIYARQYQTGQIIPKELVDKIVLSSKYGEGFKTTEYLAASFLDMDYHTASNLENLDVLKFEDASMNKIGLIPQIPPRYCSTYFQHTMGGGYTAGYYSYIWAEVLDADAFDAFRETGNIFDQATAEKFRKNILEKGGSKDAMQMYLDFRGKQPTIDPLLKNRGLK